MERTRRQFIVRWTVATLVGWTIGVGVVFTTGWILGIVTDHRSYLDLAVSTSILGFFIGLAQWRGTLKGNVSRHWWIAAITFAFVIWGIVINAGLLNLPTATHYDISRSQTHPEIIMEIVGAKIPLSIASYLLMGIAIGLPQWLVLRRQFMQAYRWLLGTAGGALALLIVWIIINLATANNILGFLVLFFTLLPVTYAGVTGYVLFDVLKQAKTA